MSNIELNNYKDLIEFSADKYSDQTAFVMRRRIKNERIFYKDIPNYVGKIFAYLSSLKVEEGQRVILWGTNSTEYALALLTIFTTGRVSVPIDYRTVPETVEKIIEQTEPSLAIVSKYLNSDFIKKRIKKIIYLEDLLSDASKFEPEELKTPDPDAICQIVYTSGTTGTPKGVQLTNRNLVKNAAALESVIPQLKSYRTVSVLPLSHVFEQVVTLTMGFILGTQITYLTKVNSLQIRRAMQVYNPTYLVLVPQLLSILLSRIEENIRKEGKEKAVSTILKFSDKMPVWLRRVLFKKVHKSFGGSLEFIGLGGAPLPLANAQKFRLMGFKLLQGYGATEVTAVATFNNNPDSLDNVGYALPGVEIKLAGKEILVRSQTLSTGYYKNLQKSAEVFKDGWYRTGDIGEITDKGRLKILGREAFRLVLKNGENVYVEDLENEILKHPEVKDVAVIGIDDQGADKVHAVFILKKGDINLGSLVSRINSTLASKQHIMSYSVWNEDDFPRTHTLKINRKKIKDFVEKELAGEESKSENVLQSDEISVEAIIAKVSSIDIKKIKDESKFATDLKLDSLARAEMMAVIEEELAISVDAIVIEGDSTVSDLKKQLAEAQISSKNSSYPVWQFNKLYKVIRLIAFYAIFFPLHAFFVKIDISNKDKEKLKTLSPNTLITVNHAGLFDSLVVLRLLGVKSVSTLILAFARFWEAKYKAKLVEFVGGFPLDQSGTNLIPALRLLSDLLEQHKLDYLLIAPQGKFDRDGKTPFQQGYKYIARELSMEIINLHIEGYEKIFAPPKGDTRQLTLSDVIPKKRGRVRVNILA